MIDLPFPRNNIVDESIVKLESTYTPEPNGNAHLKNICKELEQTKIELFKIKDNMHTLREALNSLIRKIKNKETIIKPADKCSIIVVMLPDYYCNICQSHISDTSSYRVLNDTDPCSNIVQQRVTQFANIQINGNIKRI